MSIYDWAEMLVSMTKTHLNWWVIIFAVGGGRYMVCCWPSSLVVALVIGVNFHCWCVMLWFDAVDRFTFVVTV